MTHKQTVGGSVGTLIEVVEFLTAAADRSLLTASSDLAEPSLVLGAQVVACTALDLLPSQFDAEVDEVVIFPDVSDLSVIELIRTAEQLRVAGPTPATATARTSPRTCVPC